MGKWSIYQGLEGKYLVHPSSHEVKKLKRYLFQDFYIDSNDEKVYIGDLNNIFDNEEEAKTLSYKLLAEEDAKRVAYEELRLRKEKEEKDKMSRVEEQDYLANLSYSERRYYLD